jgi:hypothetical protein
MRQWCWGGTAIKEWLSEKCTVGRAMQKFQAKETVSAKALRQGPCCIEE